MTMSEWCDLGTHSFKQGSEGRQERVIRTLVTTESGAPVYSTETIVVCPICVKNEQEQ